jgi:TonB family protein
MDVSDILRDRMDEPGGLQKMAAVSALAHVAAFAAMVLAGGGAFGGSSQAERPIMTISLGGGAAGEDTGGMTTMASRPVQAPAPIVAPKRPEPLRMPAQQAPKMTVPVPNAPRVARGAEVKNAPEEARGSTPTRGAEPAFGTALADTGVKDGGFGLATGGGNGTGSRLDVANFCCPEYIATMVQRVRSNWSDRAENPGSAFIKFTIQRDGTITNVAVDQASPYFVHNQNAQRAVMLTRQLPPLPPAFTNPSLTVYLEFIYTR